MDIFQSTFYRNGQILKDLSRKDISQIIFFEWVIQKKKIEPRSMKKQKKNHEETKKSPNPWKNWVKSWKSGKKSWKEGKKSWKNVKNEKKLKRCGKLIWKMSF